MRFQLLFWIFSLPSTLIAQSIVGSFYPKYKPTNFVYKVSNVNKSSKLLFQNNAEYEVLCLDSTFQKSNSIIIQQTEKNNRFVGSMDSDSLLTLYFVNLKNGDFSTLSITYSDSSYNWKTLYYGQKRTYFLKAVQIENTICALSVNESNDLIVRKFTHSHLAETDTFHIDYQNFLSLLKEDINLLNQESFSDVGITYVDYEVEQDISDIYTDRKLYVRDDKLVMTFDKQNTSHLVITDLVKKKSYYKKFSFKLDLETSTSTNTGNSFLYKDYFFRVTCNGHQVNLAIIDFRTFKLVRNHNIYDDQPIEIKNGPLLMEESTNGSIPKVVIIKNSEKFFNLVRGANLGVTAHKLSNDTYELLIGSYLTEIFTSPVMSSSMGLGMGMGFGMGGLGVGVGSGSMMDPYYYPNGVGNRNQNVTIKKAYFHSIMTEKDFVHIPMTMQTSYLDRKKAFWTRNFKSGRLPEIELEYRWKEKMHYGYWDKKMSKFCILEFEQ